MNPHSLLVQALVYLAAGVISVPLAKRLGLGSVLGYLVAGALVGPFVLNLVGEPTDVMRFAEFGVVILLFLIGLELRPAAAPGAERRGHPASALRQRDRRPAAVGADRRDPGRHRRGGDRRPLRDPALVPLHRRRASAGDLHRLGAAAGGGGRRADGA